jgi:hypothetical protein
MTGPATNREAGADDQLAIVLGGAPPC